MLYVKPCILKSCWSWQPWPALRGKRSSCCGSFSAREWTLAVIGGSQPWRGVVARKRGWEWVEAQTKSCRSIIRITLLLTCSGCWICKKKHRKALHTSSCNLQFAYIEMPKNKILSTPVNGSWVVEFSQESTIKGTTVVLTKWPPIHHLYPTARSLQSHLFYHP